MFTNKVNIGQIRYWHPWRGCKKISPACQNCFIKNFNKTYDYINNNKINSQIAKKGITKAIESYRIDDEKKKALRLLRKSYQN